MYPSEETPLKSPAKDVLYARELVFDADCALNRFRQIYEEARAKSDQGLYRRANDVRTAVMDWVAHLRSEYPKVPVEGQKLMVSACVRIQGGLDRLPVFPTQLVNSCYTHWLITETVGRLHRFVQIYKGAMDRKDRGLWHRADEVMDKFVDVCWSGGLARVLDEIAELPDPLVDNDDDDNDEAQMHCEDELSKENRVESFENNGDEQRNIADSFVNNGAKHSDADSQLNLASLGRSLVKEKALEMGSKEMDRRKELLKMKVYKLFSDRVEEMVRKKESNEELDGSDMVLYNAVQKMPDDVESLVNDDAESFKDDLAGWGGKGGKESWASKAIDNDVGDNDSGNDEALSVCAVPDDVVSANGALVNGVLVNDDAESFEDDLTGRGDAWESGVSSIASLFASTSIEALARRPVTTRAKRKSAARARQRRNEKEEREQLEEEKKKVDEERRKVKEEKREVDEEKRKVEEVKEELEEEKIFNWLKVEEVKGKLEEEERKLEEEKRKLEEEKEKVEEEKENLAEERGNLEEERKRLDEEKKTVEEGKKNLAKERLRMRKESEENRRNQIEVSAFLLNPPAEFLEGPKVGASGSVVALSQKGVPPIPAPSQSHQSRSRMRPSLPAAMAARRNGPTRWSSVESDETSNSADLERSMVREKGEQFDEKWRKTRGRKRRKRN